MPWSRSRCRSPRRSADVGIDARAGSLPPSTLAGFRADHRTATQVCRTSDRSCRPQFVDRRRDWSAIGPPNKHGRCDAGLSLTLAGQVACRAVALGAEVHGVGPAWLALPSRVAARATAGAPRRTFALARRLRAKSVRVFNVSPYSPTLLVSGATRQEGSDVAVARWPTSSRDFWPPRRLRDSTTTRCPFRLDLAPIGAPGCRPCRQPGRTTIRIGFRRVVWPTWGPASAASQEARRDSRFGHAHQPADRPPSTLIDCAGDVRGRPIVHSTAPCWRTPRPVPCAHRHRLALSRDESSSETWGPRLVRRRHLRR